MGTIWLATLIGDDSRLVKQFNDKKINHGMSFMGYSHENKGTVSLYTFFTDKKYFKQTLPMINNELNKIAKEVDKLTLRNNYEFLNASFNETIFCFFLA